MEVPIDRDTAVLLCCSFFSSWVITPHLCLFNSSLSPSSHPREKKVREIVLFVEGCGARMSKKKAFSGSTMTLKDFHGGSIPSDLPLPSAPGVVARSSDRQIPNAWGNPIARSDHRSRPGSSGANRNYDEKTSFFSHPAHIGRNFDEDERKPLDGHALSLPRRMVSDEPFRVQPTHSVTANPIRQLHPPNAWGTRKDVEPLHSSTYSGPNAVSKFAQATALEKVSSGRWQSKHTILQLPDVQVIDDTDFQPTGDFEVLRGRHTPIDDEILGPGKVSLVYPESKETSFSFNYDGIRPASNDGKPPGSQILSPIPAQVVERPKIKLLPRSKPLETLEQPIVDYKQGYQPPSNSGYVETINESHANGTSSKPGSSGSDGGKRAVERPRLNLKPRSQPAELPEVIAERERKALFGGARPRELVLKARGIDDVVVNNLDAVQQTSRVKQEHPKTEKKQEHALLTPVYGDSADTHLHDQKVGKFFEKKDHRADVDKTEQRGSWRNENWRNNREPEKQQQQERRPEPETWRKPVDQPNSLPSDAAGVRYGKAASALELAQAFSRSNSGAKTADRVSGQRGPPARNQIPFSRLTDAREFYSGPPPRRQINGY